MAAGMSIRETDYPAFAEAFSQVVTDLVSPDQLQACVMTDGPLAPQDFSLSFADQIRLSGPWGQQFPEPLFDGEFELIQQRIVGEKHLKLMVKEPASGIMLDAIAFFIDLERWPDPNLTRVRLVYKLEVNEFRGQRNLQLLVDYIEPL